MCKERTLTGDAIPGWNQLHDEDGLGVLFRSLFIVYRLYKKKRELNPEECREYFVCAWLYEPGIWFANKIRHRVCNIFEWF